MVGVVQTPVSYRDRKIPYDIIRMCPDGMRCMHDLRWLISPSVYRKQIINIPQIPFPSNLLQYIYMYLQLHIDYITSQYFSGITKAA